MESGPASPERRLERSEQQPQLKLNFPLTVGTQICLVSGSDEGPLVRLPFLSADLLPDLRLVSRDFFESQAYAAIGANTAAPQDLVFISDSSQIIPQSGATLKILEIGQGDQEGLVKLCLPHDDKASVWVETCSLQGEEWQVNRREGKPLTDSRLDEICDPKSDAVLRRTDDVRKFMIATLLASRGQGIPS